MFKIKNQVKNSNQVEIFKPKCSNTKHQFKVMNEISKFSRRILTFVPNQPNDNPE